MFRRLCLNGISCASASADVCIRFVLFCGFVDLDLDLVLDSNSDSDSDFHDIYK